MLVQNPVTTSTCFAGRLTGCDARVNTGEMASSWMEIVGIVLAQEQTIYTSIADFRLSIVDFQLRFGANRQLKIDNREWSSRRGV